MQRNEQAHTYMHTHAHQLALHVSATVKHPRFSLRMEETADRLTLIKLIRPLLGS